MQDVCYNVNMKILNLFKKQRNTGAILDTRQDQEKEKDYKFEEIVASANPVNWVEKTSSEWRKFPIYDQDGSSSCVAQTLGKLLGIIYWLKNGSYVHFSATDIYQKRANKPSPGMLGIDAFNIAHDSGVTLEELVPSQKMNDAQMDNTIIPEYKRKVGEIFKIPNYVILPNGDIEVVASTIQTTGKGVMVWFFWKTDEWTDVPTIKYPTLEKSNAYLHSVTAVDFALYNGEKAIIVDDSWGSSYGKAGQRVITEDFFKARNFFSAYPLNFVFDTVDTNKPHYVFAKNLSFTTDTSVKDPDVVALQDILKYEGFFPLNTTSTGYYGAITAKGVLQFQLKYAVDSVDVLNSLGGKNVGPKTIQKLNELYGN